MEVDERKKEVEAKERERIDANNQCKKMLAMVEERDAKIRRTEELTERLRDEIDKWQSEFKHLENQKKSVDDRLNETEEELKRLRSENNRLETRHYHEMRECRQTINALQQSLASTKQMFAGGSADGSGSLSPNSSERDYGSSLAPVLGAPPPQLVRPLWSDNDDGADVLFGGEPSAVGGVGFIKSRTISPDDVVRTGSSKKSPRSRRSMRDVREPSDDANTIRPKKETKRMRSRSHGRQPAAFLPGLMPAIPMGHRFPDVFGDAQYPKRNNRGNLLNYSSGGSNGGVSPPPEMPLLSGIPPSGIKIRKPTAIARPKSVNEQSSRRNV
ncbi:hypothetical protein AB6A40_009495 [Gnathostoma spinigerum]|uniref:Uncharacterized protein n=1 Tax=Gnathostoma spinigerum TaxID=75299 RepID=A0ABD6ETY6_9BILA